MDWTILGIAPTDDKKAITAAYRAKLKTTNPEEKPEEFKALRAAYEEALRLAEQPQTAPERDLSPVGLWMERITALYNDFPNRIKAENWRELLNSDVCAALDTRPQAEEALLNFLMNNYYIPRAVWQIMDETFSWMERAEELCESYPADFVEHCVVNGIRFDQTLSYEDFEPGLDGAACDAYRRLYYQCNQSPLEQRGELLDRMESLPEQHPYGRALRYHFYLENGRDEEGRAGYRELSQRYPEDTGLSLDYAAVSVRFGEFEKAHSVVTRVLEKHPDHVYGRRILAECQSGLGDLAGAKETLYDVMHLTGDDPALAEQLAERIRFWNTALIEEYAQTLADDPADAKTAIDLAWCHLQCEDPDKAMEVALKIDADRAEPFDYHNLMGKLYHNIEMYREAGEHMAKVVDILRHMEPDGTEKTNKRIRRLPEMLQILGNCLQQSGDTDGSRAAYAEALTMAPDDPKVLTMMGNIHYAAGELEDCIATFRHMAEVSPGSWFAHLMLALANYKLHRDREAFDSVNRALSMRGADLSLYVLKMQILLRNGVFDEVRSILDFLKEAGAPEDVSLDFIRAQLTELENKDTEAAFRSYQAIARRVEEGDQLMDAAQLYHRMALIMGKKSGHKTKEDRDILIDMLDKGLSHDPHDMDCLDYKAWLLQRNDRLADAIAIYKDLPLPDARRKLADLYFEDLRTYGHEALAIYEELLREHQTPELCFYAATSARRLGDLEKCRTYSQLAIDLDPGDIDAHRNLAFLLEKEGKNAEALSHIETALAVMWENDLFYDWLLNHKLKILRRQGCHAEALAAIDEAMQRSKDYSGYETKFEICCQFGLFDQAEAVLAQWSAAERGNPEITKSTGKLHLYRRKMLKATFAYGKVKHDMDKDEERDLRIQLCDLEANSKRLVQLWTKRLQTDKRYNTLMHLALELRRSGNLEASRKYAAEALPLVDEELTHYSSSELIHRTCRSMILMLLGREEEARTELALCRQRPLCEFCSYCACKDADIFEAFIEELAGNTKLAKELYLKGQKTWPDELDFVSGENRLKKKKG